MISPAQYTALHESAGWLRRESRGRLRIGGADRLSYLHGLLTNDIQALTPGVGCYAALLTAQGRMVTDMRVFETGEEVLLDLEGPVAVQVRDHLDKFVITEDAIVEDVTESWSQVGVYGPSAANVLARALADAEGRQAVASADLESLATMHHRRVAYRAATAHVIASDDVGVRGFDVMLPARLASGLEHALTEAGALEVTEAAAETTRIEAGIPRFLVDMDSSTIPLEAGIEDRAISMTKGCYVGQEVIVRVLHRGGGRVARRLVQLVAPGGLSRGDVVFSGEREVGKVTSATRSPASGGGSVALAYVQRDFSAPGTVVRVNGVDAAVRG
jgi:folate-binding protein YgfZ